MPPRAAGSRQLHQAGRLGETEVYGFARERKFEETAIALSLLCGVEIDVVERALLDPGHDMALIVAKLAGFSSTTAKAILLLKPADRGMSTQDLDQALTSYGRLQVETARRVLGFYRTRLRRPGRTVRTCRERIARRAYLIRFAVAAGLLIPLICRARIGRAVSAEPSRRRHALLECVIAAVEVAAEPAHIGAPGRQLPPVRLGGTARVECPGPDDRAERNAPTAQAMNRRLSRSMSASRSTCSDCGKPSLMTRPQREASPTPYRQLRHAASRSNRLVTAGFSR